MNIQSSTFNFQSGELIDLCPHLADHAEAILEPRVVADADQKTALESLRRSKLRKELVTTGSHRNSRSGAQGMERSGDTYCKKRDPLQCRELQSSQ